MLPKTVHFILQSMLGLFIGLSIAIGLIVKFWFKQESTQVKTVVKKAANKFLGVFLLQLISLLTQNILLYQFIYKQPTQQSVLVFQLSDIVFPIFDLLIPCAFILWTHNRNFLEDQKLIDKQYERYSSAVRYKTSVFNRQESMRDEGSGSSGAFLKAEEDAKKRLETDFDEFTIYEREAESELESVRDLSLLSKPSTGGKLIMGKTVSENIPKLAMGLSETTS